MRCNSLTAALAAIVLSVASGSASAQVPPEAKPAAPPAPNAKISGLLFGDYYSFSSDHLAAFEKQQGMWIRRAYFTYDNAISPAITTRLRLEANGNGKLAGGTMTTVIKDAYLRWTFHGRQQITVGVQPSLTWEFIESVWGLRHIEKPPVDIYKMDVSREMGFTLGGPLNKPQTLKYQLQFGNEAGFGGETDRFKGYRAAARYETNPGISIEGVVGHFNRGLNADRTTAQVFAAYRAPRGRAGFQYSYQRRRAADGSGLHDVNMAIVSGFAVYHLKPQKYSVFLRVDRVKEPCADCGGIDYLPIDTKQGFTLTIAGIEYYIDPAVRFSPNIELVNYAAPRTGSKPRKDMVARLTFFWAW